MSVKLYVEGGGDSDLDSKCRRGFQELLKKAGFGGRLPRVVACGTRLAAFDKFENALRYALRNGDEYPILLVDSEDPVAVADQPDAATGGAWRHLTRRDGRERPPGADDDQAQLMVTTMETWLIADRDAIRAYFPGMNANALPPDSELESRRKPDVARRFAEATRTSSKGRYDKGKHAFDLLGQADPDKLKSRLPHFRRFVEALDSRLSAT